VDVTEALMGHEGYLTEVYRRYSAEDLAKFYLQGEPALSVFTEAEEIVKLRKEVGERYETLRGLNDKLQLENMEIKEKLKELESKLKTFKTYIDEFNKIKEEVEFLKEGGVFVGASRKLSPEELQDILKTKT